MKSHTIDRNKLRALGRSMLEFHRILLVVFTMAVGIVLAAAFAH